MIAQGDRPAYRLRAAEDGRWLVDAMPWVSCDRNGRRKAHSEVRAAIAEWRDVPPDTFDVEIG